MHLLKMMTMIDQDDDYGDNDYGVLSVNCLVSIFTRDFQCNRKCIWMYSLGRTWFRNFRVLGLRQNSHLKQVKLGTLETNQAIQIFPFMQAVLRHFILNRSRDCSVYTSSEDRALRRTPAHVSQRTWFLFQKDFCSRRSKEKGSP